MEEEEGRGNMVSMLLSVFVRIHGGVYKLTLLLFYMQTFLPIWNPKLGKGTIPCSV